MSSHNPDQRVLSKGQAGRLLGLTINEMNVLRETGSGPAVIGTGEYVVYPAHAVRAWAMYNVHAPTLWFDRFLCDDVKEVTRTRIDLNLVTGKYYLSEYEEAWLLFSMAHNEEYNMGEGLYRLYMNDHPEERQEVVPGVLHKRPTIPPLQSVVLGRKAVNLGK
jgi:hypothetical protein